MLAGALETRVVELRHLDDTVGGGDLFPVVSKELSEPAGRYGPGVQLPSASALQARHGVARGTVGWLLSITFVSRSQTS
jgi:hypothetical protein